MPLAHLRLRGARPTAFAVVAFAVLLSIAGCKKAGDATGSSARVPSALVVVQGGDQSAQAGKDLPTPIVLRVVDSNGVGMPRVTVSLVVTEGGGAVTPPSDSTDTRGEIKLKWTLGPGVESQVFQAHVAGLDPVPVHAWGIIPAQVILVQGNGQTAKAGVALPNSILVRVVGNGNVPISGVTVGFQVLTGGGAMSPSTVVTNAFGEALTKWTMGAVGANTALVVVGTLSPVTITATAN